MYKQVRKPNPKVQGYPNLCLNYARKVYAVKPKYPTAWTAWKKSKQHRDRKLPNVSVPVWFSYFMGGVNFGHVAVYIPGDGFYSSPIGGRRYFKTLASLEAVASNIKYVGWSEDINDVAVVQPVSLVYDTVRKGEGLSDLARRAGYSSWREKERWQYITDLNKPGWNWKKYNNSLKPGMKVKVKK